MQELLELWVTRLSGPPEPTDAAPDPVLEEFIESRERNLILVGADIAACEKQIRRSLHDVAWRDANSGGGEVTGWLAIDVPVPNRVEPTALMHRMLRRLYFAAVLHGLAEIESLRDAVQSLRLSFLQTRGTVTTSESQSQSGKETSEISASLSLLKPGLAGKLTAEEEVSVVEQLSAEMQRMDLMEAEDQLLYDLQILTQLRLEIDSYTSQLKEKKIPRWERVRRFFKTIYSSWKDHRFNLRPVFVFVAHSPDSVATILTFLSSAASLASAQGGKLIVVGGAELAASFDAEAKIGHPIFRQCFDKHAIGSPGEASRIAAFIESGREYLPPEVIAVLEAAQRPARKTTSSSPKKAKPKSVKKAASQSAK